NRHGGDPGGVAQTAQRLAESRLALTEIGAEAHVGAHEIHPRQSPGPLLRWFSVRKALGVIVILAVALTAVGSTGAARLHERAALPRPEVALERALAVFRPHLADPAY